VSEEDDGYEPRAALRVGAWLVIAACASAALVMAARTPGGGQRFAQALTEIGSVPALPFSLRMPGSNDAAAFAATAERLSENVRQLTADRDRLLGRLDALERGDVTGSIPPVRRSGRLASPPSEGDSAAQNGAGNPAGDANAQYLAGAGADAPMLRTGYAVDLGYAPSLEAARGLWHMVKTKHSGMLEGLRPLLAIREAPNGQGIILHLVAGPLPSPAAAGRLCAILGAMGEPCEPTTFEGQRLALR
jgi:hypothetical protein